MDFSTRQKGRLRQKKCGRTMPQILKNPVKTRPEMSQRQRHNQKNKTIKDTNKYDVDNVVEDGLVRKIKEWDCYGGG